MWWVETIEGGHEGDKNFTELVLTVCIDASCLEESDELPHRLHAVFQKEAFLAFQQLYDFDGCSCSDELREWGLIGSEGVQQDYLVVDMLDDSLLCSVWLHHLQQFLKNCHRISFTRK